MTVPLVTNKPNPNGTKFGLNFVYFLDYAEIIDNIPFRNIKLCSPCQCNVSKD